MSLAPGFVAGGLACGIKDSGAPDLAIIATEDRAPVAAAGVFTSNLAQAAPVQVSQRHLADGRAAAVVLNSGNANAATGETGRSDAMRMCELTANGLGLAIDDVLVCSTGLIGIPMPMGALETGIPKLCADVTPEGGAAAARAIMTTDTVPKVSDSGAGQMEVHGMAKGAAMLSPAMATMLAVLTTDMRADSRQLHHALQYAVGVSFNRLSVDGCRSTNDTVLVLASGRNDEETSLSSFIDAMCEVCVDLAEQMAHDAEGATKFVQVNVTGALHDEHAQVAARAVADSQLVQCSLNGEDAYWGRVLSELGASGAFIDPERVDISYGGVMVCRDGVACPHDATELQHVMQRRDIDVLCDLKLGRGKGRVLTTDLSHAYIDENRRTS